jgi:hypothetical protein
MKYYREQMTARLCLLLCLLAGVTASAFSQQSAPLAERDTAIWKEFRSDEGGFLISFPGSPKAHVETSDAPGTRFELHIFSLTTTVEYSVMYADYPDVINDSNATLAKSVLDDGLHGAVAEMHSELLEVSAISLDGHPGRLYREKMPDGSILWGKTFLVGHRLYQIAVTTPKDETLSEEVVRFYRTTAERVLNSFRLTRSKDPQ